jgi:hypothetical protein
VNLVREIDQLKTDWANSSTLTKVLLIISGAVSCHAVTALSEEVASIKEFFRVELEFVHEWVNAPLRHLLDCLHVHLPARTVDALVIAIAVLTSWQRTMLIKSEASKWRVNVIWAASVSAFFIMLRLDPDPNINLWSVVAATVCYVQALSRNSRPVFTFVHGQLLLLVIAVGIVAAISNGLAK